MRPRHRHWLLFAGLALLAGGVLGAAGWLILGQRLPAPLVLGAALGAIVAALALAFAWLDRRWIGPAEALARELDLLVEAGVERVPELPEGHGLGPLPGAAGRLARRLLELRGDRDQALAAALRRAGEQQRRLEAILRELGDGIIGCSVDRRILLFNEAARHILGAGPALGLDRPLDALLAREPVDQAFALLRERAGGGERGAARETFICASVDGERLLRCRMAPIIGEDGEVEGFLLDFVDATARLGQGDGSAARVERLVEALRAPAAALAAAAEVLSEPAGLDDDARRRFADVVGREGRALRARLDEIAAATRELVQSEWPMDDLVSADLVRRVQAKLEGGRPALSLTQVGPALWLHGDGHHLALLLEQLLRRLHAETGTPAFDLEARQGDPRVELDLVWEGEPLAQRVLDAWLDAPVDPGHGVERLRNVLARHDSDLWSQPHAHAGRALVRLPLPAPRRPQAGDRVAGRPALPPRPEFYDFDLLRPGARAGPLLERPLGELTYVVLDTETTGLDPARDQIVQLAAVRIVNRRLLTGETFERLVDPGRPIPRASIRFHGITDAMVRGRPPIEVVLPQFRDFAADSVLVAHNAAFDLAFLRQAEARARVRFDQPVLDTLLLSVMLHDHTPEHALDAIAARFGVALVDRHRALGDAIGTAEIFLCMLDLLAASGITTLGDALRASERAVAVRRRQQAEFGNARVPSVRAVERIPG